LTNLIDSPQPPGEVDAEPMEEHFLPGIGFGHTA
jgi:hypothetical protein